jgi:hypothetical protein
MVRENSSWRISSVSHKRTKRVLVQVRRVHYALERRWSMAYTRSPSQVVPAFAVDTLSLLLTWIPVAFNLYSNPICSLFTVLADVPESCSKLSTNIQDDYMAESEANSAFAVSPVGECS